jgi:hypothetical protein
MSSQRVKELRRTALHGSDDEGRYEWIARAVAHRLQFTPPVIRNIQDDLDSSSEAEERSASGQEFVC